MSLSTFIDYQRKGPGQRNGAGQRNGQGRRLTAPLLGPGQPLVHLIMTKETVKDAPSLPVLWPCLTGLYSLILLCKLWSVVR